MKVYISVFIFSVLLSVSCTKIKTSSLPEPQYSIIPKPTELRFSEGLFHLNNSTVIQTENNLAAEISVFRLLLNETLLIDIGSEAKSERENIIRLLLTDDDLGLEGYHLDVSEETINLKASDKVGILHGLFSVLQLAMLNQVDDKAYIPASSIRDHARFQHRGLLLDCCRHFFSVDVVKKYIDLLAFYKMNTLHWHLTEDQGWRIEIEKYPKLTEHAAWRIEKDSSRYGGFYTKNQIREVVEHAAARHINVIPEIELPGHSQAAISAYPHLSCTGENVDVANDWGVFKEIYCAGNEETFVFFEDVLTEVMDLFPSKYIHIGGDEAPKTRWENCSKCQKRIRDEGLKDEHGLQSYFIKRIQKFLKDNGRELIGWDEILEGGLAEGAIVQSWRSTAGGIEAAKHGNYAIMSPTSHCYFDYSLDAIDVEKVYSFDPIASEMTDDEAKFVIGGECNMWTEHVPDEDNLDSKVFPRMLAMAEVLWSDTLTRDYDEFRTRVYQHKSLLDYFNVAYGMETIPVTFNISSDANSVLVSLDENVEDIDVNWYTVQFGEIARYSESDFVNERRFDLLAVVNRKDDHHKDSFEVSIHPHQALNDVITYKEAEYSDWYTAGGNTGLLDGILSSRNFRDGRWQGYWGNDAEWIVDLGSVKTDVKSVSSNFYQYNNAWIFIPPAMSVASSVDGKDWEEWGSVLSNIDPKKRGKFIETFELNNQGKEVRYLKVFVRNLAKVPEWHEASGADAWIFIDEIIVK